MDNMNKQDELYFAELYKDRSENADTLAKPSMRGVKKSVVEKYSDQAHFIYELLQNADDAHAHNTKFILEKDRLLFIHDGTRHFSVTDPQNEEKDSEIGTLGDINSITSIANSNKTQASIGKFGVGFKAVFQYTNTPHIYDPNFRFKIERFIVPSILEQDFPERKQNETIFEFPFDNPEREPDVAYNDIFNKLKNLSYPLLFLSELENIDYVIDGLEGFYGKKTIEKYDFSDTTAEYIQLTHIVGETIHDDYLWIFSKYYEGENGNNYKYSVGFFSDEGGKLIPKNEPAFCFFPTKATTGLKFIIHAPFLLTDSREGIRAGIDHNENMVDLLAQLAAEAIVYLKEIGEERSTRLIDDNIIKIIPYNSEIFSSPDNKDRISFRPFYDKILSAFENHPIIPAMEGYVNRENAYWASVPQLSQLFTDKQLAVICDNQNAKWVFTSIGRDDLQRNEKELTNYLDKLTKTNINEDAIICGRKKGYTYNRYLGVRQTVENVTGITPQFIENQSFDWLHEFYKWLSETKNRTDLSKDKPIFLDQNLNATPAYDKDKQLILFLPVEGISGYKTINNNLLENEDTKRFIESIGIKRPSLKDQIYNQILPLYKNHENNPDTDLHFKIFFEYYCKCSNIEVTRFIDLIKDCPFLVYHNPDSQVRFIGVAYTMYFPDPLLLDYFESKKDTRFLDINRYKKLIPAEDHEKMISFLEKIGVKKSIEIKSVKIDYFHSNRNDLPNPRSSRQMTWTENNIDGCLEIIEYIVSNKDKNKSICLWNSLLNIIEIECNGSHNNLSNLLSGTCDYFYYYPKKESFLSSNNLLLKESAWLIGLDDEFHAPSSLTVETLSNSYEIDSQFANELISFLEIKTDTAPEYDPNSNLTESQKTKIIFASKLEALGFTEDDLDDLKDFKQYIEHKRANKHSNAQTETKNVFETNTIIDSIETELSQDSPIEGTKVKVVKDIINQTSKYSPETNNENTDIPTDVDNDELLPKIVDYQAKINQAKQKSAQEIDKITYLEELQDKAINSKKYSFAWFTALLELEYLNSSEANLNSKEVSISFGKVQKEPGTKRTLILEQPNRYIPQFIEDLADIPLVLHFENTTKKILIEVSNIKSYTLRVKIKDSEIIDSLDFSAIKYATIDTNSPVFLLETLKDQFSKLGYEDSYNLRDNLCENIEFIFGPPGTGKTTYLVNNILLPLVQKPDNCKILVMAPTNKAADVIVRRIMEICEVDRSYEDWLIRFGTTGDDKIENSIVFKDKTFDFRKRQKNIVVTTIARFPYDYFMLDNSRIYLNGINWDYIVIDEASMIPIADIILPLYKKTPKKFFIAGDPFQIEPITSVELWKGENIYSLVSLDSFIEPKTIPHQYKVTLLTTQYRSIPEIGNVFSKFAYDGILKHNRLAESKKIINWGEHLNISSLNIIKYPVKKYESIYRAKRLNHSSSYQIYSALFTYEFIYYLSKIIDENNQIINITIGIIAPYRAQADLIDKLISAEKLSKKINVQVGTIHSFQGDECDIIFAVFNAPPNISRSPEMFLNKKNIVNVSISRAKDYLFIIMPDDDTDNIDNLFLVKKVEHLIKSSDEWNEFLTPDIEKQMFGNSNYLENNAFSTSHQSVNVYGLPEKSYEIRTEDNAVDIQIHKEVPMMDISYHKKVSDYTYENKKYVSKPNYEQTIIINNYTGKNKLMDLLDESGVEYIDKRKYGGVLWIIGGMELRPLVEKCKEIGITFTFKKWGGKSCNGRDAWWTKDCD